MLAVNPQSLTNSGQDIFILPVWLGPLWLWSYGSWIYNYLCSQCLSLLMLWVQIPPRWGVLDTTLCAEICQWFSPSTTVSTTNKTDLHDIINWNIVESGVKYHKPTKPTIPVLPYYTGKELSWIYGYMWSKESHVFKWWFSKCFLIVW
jgi:hypothetical protein